MKYRLGRLDKLYRDDPLYFITCCTHQRQELLSNADAHETFRSFCTAAQERGVLVGRYVLMPDHLHLFVCLGVVQPLDSWIKSLKNTLSRKFREQGMNAPHWQKGYFDHVMRSDNSYDEKWEYVRRNPLRKNLVTGLDEWPYQGEITPLPFD